MKVHTTNYHNTFIAIADDSPATTGEVPPQKGDNPTVAGMQFHMLVDNPYKYTSDDVLFRVYALRNNIPKSELKEARAQFFAKGQPCLRASPLTKRYGWGVHADADCKIAIYACGTPEYEQMIRNKDLQVVKAMRTSR
ncbi:DUF6157 family protein [Nemorincola caseinilytica]|uniref:DUF6157 family protein n=1 Tax=Nemorincola caseinilytica TaxID=2054315 RepID=A0ABP8NJW4_9BACT